MYSTLSMKALCYCTYCTVLSTFLSLGLFKNYPPQMRYKHSRAYNIVYCLPTLSLFLILAHSETFRHTPPHPATSRHISPHLTTPRHISPLPATPLHIPVYLSKSRHNLPHLFTTRHNPLHTATLVSPRHTPDTHPATPLLNTPPSWLFSVHSSVLMLSCQSVFTFPL